MSASTDLTGSSNIGLSFQNKSALDLSVTVDPVNITTGINWTFGTEVNQANLIWHDSRSTDENGETINVYNGGVEKTAFGADLTMEAIKLLYIKNTHATLTLKILGTAATAIGICSDPSDIIEIPPKGFLLWACPTAAGIDTTENKNLKFASKTPGTITYDVAILGLD